MPLAPRTARGISRYGDRFLAPGMVDTIPSLALPPAERPQTGAGSQEVVGYHSLLARCLLAPRTAQSAVR
jgi:hypothetical protein